MKTRMVNKDFDTSFPHPLPPAKSMLEEGGRSNLAHLYRSVPLPPSAFLGGRGRGKEVKKIHGFTLIELLIVMIIISITASIAVITISANPRKQYETFATELTNTILLAEQEAMLRPATLGLGFTSHSYQFYIREQNPETHETIWSPLSQTGFKEHKFPSNMQLTLKINNEIVPPNAEPALIIPPSNDLTPFVILIGKYQEKPYYQIIGKANGEVSSEEARSEK
ncbi:MAG TPA: type II secretion system minor pseudopilin GspH [Gammaproteobacteria bacterium]|nr:type II secretion system minor pseudopilin GspH [Gammaproteobacteria bacterium]